MIDLLCAVVVGMILGYFIKSEQKPPMIEILTNQIEKLEENVAYYKDLCKWHVEEKEKLQKIKDQYESECG